MTEYDVSFYTDMHSTDGMNYQADVTWCDNGDSGLANSIYNWLRTEMQPDLESFLEDNYNHKTGVCYDATNPMDPTAGYVSLTCVFVYNANTLIACRRCSNSSVNCSIHTLAMALPILPTMLIIDRSQPICWRYMP